MHTPMTSCHLIPTWHKWNANTDDFMMMWFALYADLVTSHLACMMHIHMHGICALNKYVASEQSSGLACTQADLNLAKITATHFWVINTQNGNENIPNMIPIAYLNENFMDCNENLARGK